MNQKKAEEIFLHARCSAVQPLILMHWFLGATDKREIKSLKEAYMYTACLENAMERYLSYSDEKQDSLKANMLATVEEEFEAVVNQFRYKRNNIIIVLSIKRRDEPLSLHCIELISHWNLFLSRWPFPILVS